MNNSYKLAGVDVEAGYEAVELMKKHIGRTFTKGVIGSVGGFGGLFAPDLSHMKEPVLVSGTDGVGTKLKLAFLTDRHDTVGIDCVAMCANDIICSGAKPLFFLDYIAVGKNEPKKIEAVVKGVCEGCEQAGCALIGGETAEMPGFYRPDEYDLAGFCVGIVDKEEIIDASSRVKPSDALIALPSSGVHSNGFSLVRKIFKVSEERLAVYVDDLGATLGETLLTPTRIYVKPVLKAAGKYRLHGICHITGGGFYENIPRILPDGTDAVIPVKNIRIPPIFEVIARTGNIGAHDMYNTFNMGVGMIIAADGADAGGIIESLREDGVRAYILGEISAGSGHVKLV